MLEGIYWVIIALNIVCLLGNRKSKIIQFCSFVFLIILMAGNTYNNDYWAYLGEYVGENYAYFQNEHGLRFIFSLGNLLGLSYQTFLFFVFTFCLASHVTIAKKMNANTHVLYFLYLLFGFIADTVVLRNYIALTFLTIALYMLYKQRKLKSFFFMALAFLFHKTMLFYFPLLFIDMQSLNIKKLIKFGSLVVLILCGVAFVAGSRFEALGEFINIYVFGGSSVAYLSTSTNYGFLIYFAVQLTSVCAVSLAAKLTNNTFHDIQLRNVQSFLNFCFLLNLYVIVSFPLLMISVAMHRLFRNLLILNIIALGSVVSTYKLKISNSKYAKLLFVVLVFGLVWRVLYFFEMPIEFSQIIENNIFLK